MRLTVQCERCVTIRTAHFLAVASTSCQLESGTHKGNAGHRPACHSLFTRHGHVGNPYKIRPVTLVSRSPERSEGATAHQDDRQCITQVCSREDLSPNICTRQMNLDSLLSYVPAD